MKFEATLTHLPAMMNWVRGRVAQAGFSSGKAKKIELAMEEALVNIIHHAYKDKGGVIEMNSDTSPHTLKFEIRDTGPPFNPLEKQVESQEAGGFGILFMKKCMDEVHYRREGATNVLTLVASSRK